MKAKHLALTLSLLLSAPLAHSAWQILLREGSKRVEVEADRVVLSEAGKPQLWSRLVLASPATDPATGKQFVTVEMLSRFDCSNRGVATLERVLLDEYDRVIRNERVAAAADMPIPAGAVDEKLYGVACKLSPEAVLRSRAPAEALAQVSRADLRSGMTGQGGRIVPVNDSHAAPEKPAGGDKIQLPIKKTLNPEIVPPVKKGLVNPEQIPEQKRSVDLGVKAENKADNKSLERVAEKLTEKAEKSTPLRSPEQEYRPSKPKPKPKPKPKAHPAPAKHDDHGSATATAPAAAHGVAGHAHWSYEGETGPANWGKLSPANVACDWGTRQSPIDIRDGVKVDLPEIKFDYRPSLFSIVDNGHTVQVNYGDASSSLTVQGRRYDLVQFHFHKPSEERINGRVYDMVAHLVHKDDEGHLAVVAVLMERGTENPFIQTLWNNLPLEPNAVVQPPDLAVDLTAFLPENRSYFTYMGSLTTPPCTEGVLWMVMKNPVKISQEQINIFARLYRNNARPIQKTLGRLVKESR